MNILFITPFLPQKDGIADYAYKLANEIKKIKNIDLHIITFKNNTKDIPNIHYCLTKKPMSIYICYKKILKINPEIIHIQYDLSNYMESSIFLFIMIWFLKKRIKIKVAITFHEIGRDIKLYGIVSVLFYTIVSSLFDRIYVHTHDSRDALIKNCKVPPAKVKQMSHGTYVFSNRHSYKNEIFKKYKLDNKFVILFFGFIYRHKGIEYLIQAIKELATLDFNHGEFTLLIVGGVSKRSGLLKIFGVLNQQYFDNLKKLSAQLGIKNNVIFTGYLNKKYIYTLFKESKIVILPYTTVEQSSVLNIAFASHTPVIASNIGGLKESLRNSGILVPSKNHKAIANSIISLAGNKDQYNKIVKDYVKINRSQSTKNIARQLVQDYQSIL